MAARRSRSSSWWAAVKVKRSRAVPSGTVGGRMAATRKPPPAIVPNVQRLGRAADDQRYDRAGCSGQAQRRREAPCQRQRPRRISGIGGNEIERRDRRRHGAGRQAGGVDEAARAVAQEPPQHFRWRTHSRHRRRSLSRACPSAGTRPPLPASATRRGRARRRSSARHRASRPGCAQGPPTGARSPSMENTVSVDHRPLMFRAACASSKERPDAPCRYGGI